MIRSVAGSIGQDLGNNAEAELRLRAHLRRLQYRSLLVGIGTGVLVGLIAALAGWLLLVWLDLLWELSSELRLAANVVAAAVWVAVFVGLVWLARRRSRELALARRLDETADTGGQILSGYDLAYRMRPTRDASQLTRGLANLAVDRAATLAGSIPGARAISARPVKRSLLGAAGVGLAIAAVAVLAPRLSSTEWLRFADPFGDHPPYSRLSFTVEPGDTRIQYGSGLDIHATTEGPPAERVELVLRSLDGQSTAGEEILPMFPEPGNKWRAVLTKVTEPARYYVRAARSRSHQFALDVITIPKIEEVRLRVTPPAYTRRPAYEGPLPQGGLAGLPGTEVQIVARSNRPLRGGDLHVTMANQPQRIALEPRSTGSDEVSGTFRIQGPGKFELRVTDVDGLDSRDSFAGTITQLVDESPFIRIRQPAPISLATPLATLPVVLAGEDDYGISRIQLFRSLNDSRALPLEMDVPTPTVARLEAGEPLPLAAYGLAPGDVIKLFARIEDNDPAGAKGSESPVVEVRIISQEEFERMVRQRQGLEVLLSKYRQAQRRLEALAAKQEGLRKKMQDQANANSPQVKKAMRKLAKQLRNEAKEVRKSAEHLLPYDVDKNLSKHLEQLAKALDQLADEAQQASELESPTPADLDKLLEKMAQQLGKQKQNLQKQASEPLEHLEQIYPLIEDQSRFAALAQQQHELAEQLASLKGMDGQDNPALKSRMRDLAAEQRQINDSLQQLLGDIENHVARLPEDPRLDQLRETALKFADAVRASGAAEAMTDAEMGLDEFSGTRGHEGAAKAAAILEKFLSQCQGMGESAGSCLKFQPALAAALGNTIAQLLADAGMKPGDGPGDGGSSGFSSRRTGLDNIGLYGQIPGVNDAMGKQGGNGDSDRSSADRDASDPRTLQITPGDVSRAAGGSETAIPIRYRSRVGAYFQRILEERPDRSKE